MRKPASRLYLANTEALKSPAVYERAMEMVSPERREKTRKLHMEKDRRLSLGAGLLLQQALADYLGQMEDRNSIFAKSVGIPKDPVSGKIAAPRELEEEKAAAFRNMEEKAAELRDMEKKAAEMIGRPGQGRTEGSEDPEQKMLAEFRHQWQEKEKGSEDLELKKAAGLRNQWQEKTAESGNSEKEKMAEIRDPGHATRRGASYDLQFSYGEKGKPYLQGEGMPFFNCSHAGDLVLCAVSDREIGCDIEVCGKSGAKIAKRFFQPAEQQWIQAADPKEQPGIFCELWTRKESFLKACGQGLSLPMNSFSVLTEEEKLLLAGQSDTENDRNLKENIVSEESRRSVSVTAFSTEKRSSSFEKYAARRNPSAAEIPYQGMTYYCRNLSVGEGYRAAVCGLDPALREEDLPVHVCELIFRV